MAKKSKLKMRFKLHSLEFELEGREKVVKEEFNNFKSFIIKDLLNKVNFTENQTDVVTKRVEKNNIDTDIIPVIEIEGEPKLKEVILNDLPSSELEWVLVYAYYVSDFGKNTFTIEDIKSKYEDSGRKNENRFKGLSRNIRRLVNKGYFKVHNDTEFLLKLAGVTSAKAILSGKPKSNYTPKKLSPKSKKNSSKKTTSESYNIDRDLNLRGNSSVPSFKNFYEEKKPNSTAEFNAVAVYYLQIMLKFEKITLEQVYTCYKEVKKKPADHFKQSFRDTKTKQGYIEYDKDWHLLIPHRGISFVEHDLPKK